MSRLWLVWVALLAGILLLMAVGSPCLGNTYRVASTGNDSANGLTAATAWRTIQKGVNALQPGDSLIVSAGNYIEAVQTVRDGTASAPITITAVGTALISSAVDLPDASFVPTPGQPGIFQLTTGAVTQINQTHYPPVLVDDPNDSRFSMIEADGPLPLTSDKITGFADLQRVDGGFWYSGGTLYVNPFGNSTGDLWALNNRAAFTVKHDHIILDGFRFWYAASTSGGAHVSDTSDSAILKNLWFAAGNLYVRGTRTRIENIKACHCNYRKYDSGESDPWAWFTGNSGSGLGLSGTDLTVMGGRVWHNWNNVSSSGDRLTVDGLIIHGAPNHAWLPSDHRGLVMRNVVEYNCQDGIYLSSCENVLIENCTTFGGMSAQRYPATSVIGIGPITVRNSIFLGGTGWPYPASTPSDIESRVTFENCLFLDAGSNFRHVADGQKYDLAGYIAHTATHPSEPHVTFRECRQIKTGFEQVVVGGAWRPDTDSWDVHVTGRSSPAYNQGAPVSPGGKDFEGDPRPAGGKPDIGADEFKETVAPPPPTPIPPTLPIGFTLWATWPEEKIPVGGPERSDSSGIWSPGINTIWLEALRGETVSVQLVIWPRRDLAKVTVGASGFYGSSVIPRDSLQLYLEKSIYIDSANPTQPGKLPSGWYYDPMIPLPATMALSDASEAVIFVRVHVPESAREGSYVAAIAVLADGRVHGAWIRLRVLPAILDDSARPRAIVGLAAHHFVRRYELSGWQQDPGPILITRYLEMAYDYGLDLILRGFEPPGEDPTRWDWGVYDRTFAPWIVQGGPWALPLPPIYRAAFDQPSDSAAVATMAGAIKDHWIAKGWPLESAYAFIHDEPREVHIVPPDRVVKYAETVHRAAPGVNLLMAESVEDSAYVAGSDWLMSTADRYYPPEMNALFPVKHSRWFYQSYAEPALPMETIDAPGINFRIWPWIAERYDVGAGALWCGNCWSDDPFIKPDVGTWNDGQGTLFYPGDNGPLPSLRLAAWGAGNRDAALIGMVRAKGRGALADSLLRALVPSALCAYYKPSGPGSHYTGPRVDPRWTDRKSEWNQDPAAYDAAIRVLRRTIVSQ